MIGAVGEVPRVHGVIPVRGASDNHACVGHQARWEGTADVGGGLVDEGCELGLVGGVEEEVAEAVVRVHDLDFGEEGIVHVRAVQRDSVEVDVSVNGVGLFRTSEVDRFCIVGDALDCFLLRDFNLKRSARDLASEG